MEKAITTQFDIDDVKYITTVIKPVIDSILTTFFSPKLKKLDNWLNKESLPSKIDDDYYNEKFKSYLLSTYKKYSIINTLVYPNHTIQLKEIYQPATIVSTKEGYIYNFNKDWIALLGNYKKILIADSAGMGKSTLMKWITISVIEKKLGIPIMIELRKLNKDNNIVNEIIKQINPLNKPIDKDLILKIVELGEFCFFLDGFDEIQNENKEFVMGELKEFIHKADENWFFLTSRPESSLVAFGEFQMFKIEALSRQESYELIRKYDKYNKNEIGEQLIKNIENDINQSKLDEFLINPFLVSLLYRTYTYNKDIPSKKITFYDEVYTSLYKNHDLTKDGFKRNKESGLDIQDFRIVLRQLAFDTSKLNKTEYTEQELYSYLAKVRQKCSGFDFKETNYLIDLVSAVPIFLRDGVYIKWAHKSIQDYFAAEFISLHSEKEKIIDAIYTSQKESYINILDLLYEIDYKLFRKVIINKLVSDFVNYCDNNFVDTIDIPIEEIKFRQSVTFLIDIGVLRHDNNKTSFDDARKLIEGLIPGFEFNVLERTPNYFKFYRYRLFYTQLCNILKFRGENIFIDQINIKSKYHSDKWLNKIFKNENEFQLLNNESNSTLNSSDNFIKFNHFLRGISHFSNIQTNIYLDYYK
jgi:hypothetical protein